MRQSSTFALVVMLVLSSLALVAPQTIAAPPAPHADAGDDQVVSEEDVVNLDGSGSWDLTPDEDLTYTWDFDDSNGTDDIDARGVTVTTKYIDSGAYTVTLTVSDGDNEDTDQCRITVLPNNLDNVPPKAIIREPTPGIYNVSEAITFDGSAFDPDDEVLTAKWDFGDGTTSTQPQTTHSYSEERPYHISFRVDDGKANNTAHVIIYIGESPNPEVNERPDAVLNASKTDIDVGERVFFSAANSTDHDNDPLRFAWDFDISDGLQEEETWMEGHWVFNESGDFTVSVQVFDNNPGGWDIATEEIHVSDVPNNPPEANAGNDATVQVGVSLSFRGTGSDPDSDNITLYRWDFGDGATWESNETGRTNHSYREPGNFTATFSVEDERGATGSDTRLVEVTPLPDTPPTAYAGEDFSVDQGEVAQFEGKGSDDFGIAKYQWDFENDGIWDVENQYNGYAQFTYKTDGIYTAVLRVTERLRPGNPGPAKHAEDRVRVTVFKNQPPTAKIDVPTLFVNAGELVRFKSLSTDPEGAQLLYAWDLDGDGSQDDSTSQNPSWTYTRGGTYQVTLTVTDDYNNKHSDQIDMVVSQLFIVELEVDSDFKELNPGESHEFLITVANKGNGDDQIRMEFGGANSDWARLDHTLLELSRGERQTVTLTIAVPSTALASDTAVLNVRAKSDFGAASASEEVIVEVRQHHGLKAEIDIISVSLDKEESRESVATITITNEGNGADSFRITFSGDIANYLNPSEPKIDLAPGESRDVTLSAYVIKAAPSGEARGTIIISSTKSTATQTLDFTVTVKGEGEGGGSDLLGDWRVMVGIAVLIAAAAAIAATTSRKKKSSRASNG